MFPKKSDIGLFIEANREFSPVKKSEIKNPIDMSLEELEAFVEDFEGDDSTFTEQALSRNLSLTLKHPNTYHVRQQIKALGGRWNADDRGWDMPNQAAYNKAWDLCRASDGARFAANNY